MTSLIKILLARGNPSRTACGKRTFLPWDLPAAELPAQRYDLKGHPRNKRLRQVVVLSGSGNIATSCQDGHVRVFDACGNGNLLHDIPAHGMGGSGLATVGGHVLVSASEAESKLHTWDATTGQRIHTLDVGDIYGILAIAAVRPGKLVAGLASGGLVFIQHTRGRQLAEEGRYEHAHSDWIRDIAWHEDVMVTASDDKTARVWSLSMRKPLSVLRGHRDWVRCAAINSRYIATGSKDMTLLLFANGADFPLISVLDGLHTDAILSMRFIGTDLLLSGSGDCTVCFTAVSPDARPIARLGFQRTVRDTAITADGQIACVGWDGAASVCAAPLALTDAVKELSVATFGSVAKTPVRQMLTHFCARKSLYAEDVRAVLTEKNCSASLSEYIYAHNLVMASLKCGLLKLPDDDWWFYNNLYVYAKNLHVRRAERPIFQQCLSEAKEEGLIDSKMAIDFGNAISSELRDGKEVLRAVMFQVDRLSAQLRGSTLFLSERIDRIEKQQDADMELVSQQLDLKSQEIAILRGAFDSFRLESAKRRAIGHALRFGMHLIPLVGGVIAEGVGAVASAAELTRGFLGAGVGMVGEAQDAAGKKVFVRASMSLEQLKSQPHLQRELLDGLGISSFDRVEAMLIDGQSGVTELDEVDVFAEVETVIGEMSALVKAAEKMAIAVGNVTEPENVETKVSPGRSSAEIPDFHFLKERGITAEVVMRLDSEDLGELIAAYLVNFQVKQSKRFVDFRKSVASVLETNLITGELLVGEDRAVDSDALVSLVLQQLELDDLQTPFTQKQLENFVNKFMDR